MEYLFNDWHVEPSWLAPPDTILVDEDNRHIWGRPEILMLWYSRQGWYEQAIALAKKIIHYQIDNYNYEKNARNTDRVIVDLRPAEYMQLLQEHRPIWTPPTTA